MGNRSYFRTLVTCALVALALVAVPGQADARRLPASLQIIKEINGVRTTHGLRALHVAHNLRRSSWRFAHRLISWGYFGHASRIQASSSYHYKGEILEIHRGRRARVIQAVREWLHSPPHRAVILDPRFVWVGAGRSSGRMNGRRRTIWVMQFGRR